MCLDTWREDRKNFIENQLGGLHKYIAVQMVVEVVVDTWRDGGKNNIENQPRGLEKCVAVQVVAATWREGRKEHSREPSQGVAKVHFSTSSGGSSG